VRRSVVLLAVLAVVLAACKVDATVRLDVRDDGSGTVVARVALDAEAVKAAEVAGAKVEDAVRLGDLTEAGWRSRWRRTAPGGAVLTLRKGFARPEDAGAVVAELNGPDGPVRDVRVRRDASTFSTDWSFSGVGDRKDAGTGITTDAELLAKLGAERVDVAALDQGLLLRAQSALRLRVIADLPHAGATAFRVAAGERVAMHEASGTTAYGRVLLLVAGIAVGVVALVLLVAGERRARRRRARGVTRPG
jgi:hypothetical protein